MFFGDEKKLTTLIRSRKDHKGNVLSTPVAVKPEIVKHEDGEVDGRHLAMQDFMAAHADKSPAKMAEALINFLDIHHATGDHAGEKEPE